MVGSYFQQSIRVCIQLFLGIRKVDQGQHGQHHSLIPPGQIIHVFLGFSALLLHIVRDGSREIVVGILPALPVGDVGFHTQHLPFHFPDSFIGGNRDNIDGQHHAPALIRQLGDELIGNKGSIVLQIDHTGELSTQLQIIAVLLNGIRADIVLEIMTLFHHILHIEPEVYFLAAAVEVMEDTQLLRCIHFSRLSTQSCKPGSQFRSHPGEVGSCFCDVLLADGYRDILLLDNAVACGGLVHDDIVILPSEVVQIVTLQLHKHRFFKVLPVEVPVVDGDFGGSTAV